MVNKYNRHWATRPDTLDEYVIKEQTGYAELFKDATKNDILLDLGGNIGATAGYALDKGVGQVISVEPEPENCELFKQNVPEAKLYEGMADTYSGEGELWLNSGKNKGLHSPRKIRGRESILVKKYSMNYLFNRYCPTLLKVDIEGGEYYISWSNIPRSVRRIAFEIDVKTWINYTVEGKRQPMWLYDQLTEQFPTILKDTSQDKTKLAWNWVLIAER